MSRASAEDGFTLMEVIVAMAVGFVLLAATLGLLESTIRLNTGVMAKTDSMQRGRQAMDAITQQLRSQVCFSREDVAFPGKTSAILAGSDASSVTFYTDYTETGDPPVKRRLRYDTATKRILSERYNAPQPLPNPFTPDNYPAAPSATQMVLENVNLQQPDGQPAPTPFLRYFKYEIGGDGILRASSELMPPLDADEAKLAARVEIAFLALPTGSKDTGKAVNLTDEITARHADPNSYDSDDPTNPTVPYPRCA